MKVVKNFSRHPFNRDQKVLLKKMGLEYSETVLAPSFKGGSHVLELMEGETAAAVIPSVMLLDAQHEMLSKGSGTLDLISWVADPTARKRGRFAVRGVVRHRITASPGMLDIQVLARIEHEPSVENDFRTGEAFPYQS